MPISTNFLERLVLLGLNQGPGPLLDLFGFAAFRGILAAIQLGVFEELDAASLTSAELARKLQTDGRATALLLNSLEALGYVSRRKDRYSNTKMTQKWVLRSSPRSVADLFSYWGRVAGEWDYLSDSIRKGSPVMPLSEWLARQPGGWQDYQEGMIALSHTLVDEVIARVKLPSVAARLLDVGGGHGLYSIRFCQRYPGLSSSIIDLPQAMPAARKNIAEAGMDQRIKFREGNFWTDELGSGYDVALLFNIIHGYLPKKNTELLRKVAGTLNPRGMIVIMDQLGGRKASWLSKAIVSLMGLSQFNSIGGQTYESSEVAGWLRTAGFSGVRHLSLRRSPSVRIVMAVVGLRAR